MLWQVAFVAPVATNAQPLERHNCEGRKLTIGMGCQSEQSRNQSWGSDFLHRHPSQTSFTDILHRHPSQTSFTDILHRHPSQTSFTNFGSDVHQGGWHRTDVTSHFRYVFHGVLLEVSWIIMNLSHICWLVSHSAQALLTSAPLEALVWRLSLLWHRLHTLFLFETSLANTRGNCGGRCRGSPCSFKREAHCTTCTGDQSLLVSTDWHLIYHGATWLGSKITGPIVRVHRAQMVLLIAWQIFALQNNATTQASKKGDGQVAKAHAACAKPRVPSL